MFSCLQYEKKKVSTVFVFSHIGQEVYHRIGSTHSHQLDFVAQQYLHSHENQDFTGAADHLVPNSVDAHYQPKTGINLVIPERHEQFCFPSNLLTLSINIM